ncbi:MAG: 5'/3'-nucleotidase SurE [Candidatus Auribacterota bacterium]|jgi:5'-nucleotidase|nr:5'/3'-nucleotidase SurE [Candidatus Auribacterota bacterium]
MSKQDPLILLTNDDGIHSKGLLALYQSLKEVARIAVVAPFAEQSAVGHAITISDPLRVTELSFNDSDAMYAVHGTPADCVKLAVRALLKEKPDAVLSGINIGSNTAINILYSGTVSAATEGTILGIPSAAISLASFSFNDFSVAAQIGKKIAGALLEKSLPPDTILNINVPPVHREDITGVCITRQGVSRFKELYDRRIDPHGHTYYWLTGEMRELDEHDPLTDTMALKNNAISITPIKIQLTDEPFIDIVQSWNISL